MNASNSGLAHGTSGSPQTTIENGEAERKAVENVSQCFSMPKYQHAVTPREKFIAYSLNYSNPNAKGKAEAYERGLGYTISNAEGLISQIHNYVTEGRPPYEVSRTQYGIKYKFRIPVTGPNGKTRNVIAVYQLDNGETIPRMITNYLEGK